ncbi:MAG: flagellar motor protein MotB [Candidatus Riflebacteria bacterium]|nr:flagellar motor protein MotB [Candidatus Riflebacteria bacterium]
MLKREHKSPSAALWYVSYGDLVTNMLCLFVMLFAFSSLDSPKKRQESQSLDQRFYAVFSINQAQGAHQWLTQGDKGILLTPASQRNEAVRIVRHVKNKLSKVTMHDRILVTSDDQTVKIQIPANVLFESGSANMKKGAEEVLIALVPILGTIDNYIRIDGHTDDLPPNAKSNFPSNWELSSARACTVVRYFVNEMNMDPERFSAQGYADNRPKIQNTSDTAREINRRVEIIILHQKKKKVKDEVWH